LAKWLIKARFDQVQSFDQNKLRGPIFDDLMSLEKTVLRNKDMLSREQASEILKVLNSLPQEKIAEVQDFALFLKSRYGVDEKSYWTEEDIEDFSAAVFNYADESFMRRNTK